METAELRCYRDTPRYPSSYSLSARESGLGKLEGGMEGRGIVLLVVCGLYALFLFLVARSLKHIFGKVASPVTSIVWRKEFTSVSVSNKTIEGHKKEVIRDRTFSHG
ncbi:hypothetical protein DPMN_055548 [Dreissena polymorpha]|uniref:Uncharacterized protein n=2 Tax=Dreissena polymorpha TaxID=45954 RepID=A0A9D4CSW3_DREPO|nr:hypothetical protein DPMN_055548 [Dreissena polymorpha]